MIFYYSAHCLCTVVYSTRWCAVASTSHSLERCEYSAPSRGLNFHAHVWAFSLLCWPLAWLTPDCCSDQVLNRECEALEQMRCLLPQKQLWSAVYAHSAEENTIFAQTQTSLAPSCGQNLFSPFPFFLFLLQVKELLWSSSKLQLLASSATTHHKKSSFTYFHAKRWQSCWFHTLNSRTVLELLCMNCSST